MKKFTYCAAILAVASASQVFATSEEAVFPGKPASKLEISGAIDQYGMQSFDGQVMLTQSSGQQAVHVDFMNSGPGRFNVNMSVNGFPFSQWGDSEFNVTQPFPLTLVEQAGTLRSEMFPTLDSVFVRHNQIPTIWEGRLDFSQVNVSVGVLSNLSLSSDGSAESAITSVEYSNGQFKLRAEDGREKVLPLKFDSTDRKARVVAAVMEVLEGDVVSTLHEGNAGSGQTFTVKTEAASV